MNQLTVLIPCKNEQQHIVACIASARQVADEILVADSGSTDDTLSIVQGEPDCRLIEREFVSYADFKNWAIPQAQHEWILVLDADERITPELASEIREVLSAAPDRDAYRLRRQNFFLGQPIHHCGWNRSQIQRLFRKSVCRYRDCRVHEELNVDPARVGQLHGKLLHYTCVDFDSFALKQVKYSIFSAEDRYEKGGRISYLGTLLHAPLRFLQLFILRGGILDGFAGLILCLLLSYYSFLKDAKLWSLHEAARAGQSPHLSAKRHTPVRTMPHVTVENPQNALKSPRHSSPSTFRRELPLARHHS